MLPGDLTVARANAGALEFDDVLEKLRVTCHQMEYKEFIPLSRSGS
jgi:hypothetical protein